MEWIRRILVVDADGISACALRLILARGGEHHVHVAHCVAQALTNIFINDYNVIVVAPDFLLDVRGKEALTKLRAQTSVAFLTLLDHVPSEEERAMATAGGDDFLLRPCSTQDLLNKVASLPVAPLARTTRAWPNLPRSLMYARVQSVAKILSLVASASRLFIF